MKSQNEARLKTEDASENLHLSLVNSVKDNDNPNPGLYTFDERAQGKGSWVVVINSGYNWEQVPEVRLTGQDAGRLIHSQSLSLSE